MHVLGKQWNISEDFNIIKLDFDSTVKICTVTFNFLIDFHHQRSSELLCLRWVWRCLQYNSNLLSKNGLSFLNIKQKSKSNIILKLFYYITQIFNLQCIKNN